MNIDVFTFMNEFLRKLRKSSHLKCSTDEEESSNEHRRGENLTISNTVNQEYQIVRIEINTKIGLFQR